MTYECPNQGECGFGNETPWRCKHGAWVPSGAAAPSSGPTRVKVPRELALKLLGLRAQPPVSQNLWIRNEGPRAAVQARYRADEAGEALEKQLRERFVRPVGLSMMRDPQRPNILIPVSEFVARGL